jgi:hypothetical protein
MDFSAYTNLSEEKDETIIKPKNRKAWNYPIKTPKSADFSDHITPIIKDQKKTIQDICFLGVSYLAPTNHKINYQTSYNNKPNKVTSVIDKTFKYRKRSNSIYKGKTVYSNSENKRLLKNVKNEFEKIRLEDLHKRCKTALASEDFRGFSKSFVKNELKKKVLKIELIPQTKACSVSKSPSPTSLLSVTGVNKDIETRKCLRNFSITLNS